MRIAAAVTCLLLSGCLGGGWTHTNNDEARFQQDHAECDYASTKAQLKPSFDPGYAQSKLYHECLEAKGYKWERAGNR